MMIKELEELEISRPWFRRRLFISDNPYFLIRSQDKGEKDLVRIAKTAEREYGWFFYKETNSWVHPPAKHVETEKEGRIDMSLEIPYAVYSDAGNNPIYYHIHPDKALGTQFPKNKNINQEWEYIWIALPSQQDREISLQYTEFTWKIATSKGITTYSANTKEAASFNIKDFLEKRKKNYIDNLEGQGFSQCLPDICTEIGGETIGTLQLSFKPITIRGWFF